MSASVREFPFLAVRTVGGLLPEDMLLRVAQDGGLPGSAPSDYGMIGQSTVSGEAERIWPHLLAVWRDLRRVLPRQASGAPAPADPTNAAATRWIGPFLEALGFGRLAGLRSDGITADDDPERVLGISHRYAHALVHIVPWDQELDRRDRAGGAPPQSLVQEALNRTSAHLWGVVTNGRRLRLLRDSSSLAGSACVEVDLAAIFDGELFSEFVLALQLLHASRFEARGGGPPSSCWLEEWREEALRSGVRALDALRDNVERAVTALGTGFLRHPANASLRTATDANGLHAALLRLVFRLVFLMVVEDRDLLHPPDTGDRERRRYAAYFSTARLRRTAERRGSSAHGDLYEALSLVLDALGDEEGRPELGLVGLGGLFSPSDDDAPLRGLRLSNEALLLAVRSLSRVHDTGSRRWRQVSFRTLSSRELGAVYESLLETVPQCRADDLSFHLVHRAGNQRKTTGAYYTPASLISRLLDSALEPVLDDAVKRGELLATEHEELDPADTIAEMLLSVTVCDPACGSGHFLVAAGHRIAKRVAAYREGTLEATEEAYRDALHDVVARCLYGVDLNPMAVAITRMSLWLEGMSAGRPLDLLDPHLKHGNALVGATPRQIDDGIPDAAFHPVEGDDVKVAAAFQRTNRLERQGQDSLFDPEGEARLSNTDFAQGLHGLYAIRVGSLRDVRQQERVYRDWQRSSEYRRQLRVADAWCAAFFWEKTAGTPRPVTAEVFEMLKNPEEAAASARTHAEIERLRERHRFFHWHLEFPDIFPVGSEDAPKGESGVGWSGGFDCVLANPPWDKLDFEDKKYFSVVEPSIARITGVARRGRIAEWAEEEPEAGERYRQARRSVKSMFHFAARSSTYEKCSDGLRVKGVNSLQVDQLFMERFTALVHRSGSIGAIAPTALATGAGAQKLFDTFTRHHRVESLYDFENLQKLFLAVDARQRFCLLTLNSENRPAPVAKYAFFVHDPVQLDGQHKVFELSPEEIELLSPNTGSLPAFRSRRDADLTTSIYRSIPPLWKEREGRGKGNPWGIRFRNLFNMTDDSDLFRVRAELEEAGWVLRGNVFHRDGQRMLPLYEGKMVHHFDHRRNGFSGESAEEAHVLAPDEKNDPEVSALPRYWVPEEDIPSARNDRNGMVQDREGVASRLTALAWEHGWLYGWRDVSNATNERTAIPAFLPRTAVGHTFPLMFSAQPPPLVAALCAVQSSLVFDYVSRQKITGAHMSLMTWKQLPVPHPEQLKPHLGFLVPRVLELVYTAHDMEPLARDLGYEGPPFAWDEERRAAIRAELDAYMFHLYGLGREDTEYVLETFRTERGGLRNNEIARYGTYRTKDMVLEAFDRTARAGVDLKHPLNSGEGFGPTPVPAPGQGGL